MIGPSISYLMMRIIFMNFFNNLIKYTNEHEMKINDGKTKAILFNNAVKSDFFPNLTLNDTPLEIVKEIQLVCVMVSSDLSWERIQLPCVKKHIQDFGCSGD